MLKIRTIPNVEIASHTHETNQNSSQNKTNKTLMITFEFFLKACDYTL
jgi:hypothetical protein